MYTLVWEVEKSTQYSASVEAWKRYKRDAVHIIFMGGSEKGVNTMMTITHLALFLKEIEKSMNYSAAEDAWKDLRPEWIKALNSLIETGE